MMDYFKVCLSEVLSIEKCVLSGTALACPPTRRSKCLHDRWAMLQSLEVSKLEAYYTTGKILSKDLHGSQPFSKGK